MNPDFGLLIQKLLEGEARHYNARRESLWVRDGVLVHQDKRPDYVVRQRGEMSIQSGGGAVIMGSVEVQGDFIGRDQISRPSIAGRGRRGRWNATRRATSTAWPSSPRLRKLFPSRS
ncbi:MAG: hypothetical protein H5T62_14530 [Anaerolineae bacterium]|nr:hypothetical protein [Anaerolineae bacterium]